MQVAAETFLNSMYCRTDPAAPLAEPSETRRADEAQAGTPPREAVADGRDRDAVAVGEAVGGALAVAVTVTVGAGAVLPAQRDTAVLGERPGRP